MDIKNISEEEKAKINAAAFADGIKGSFYSNNAVIAKAIGEYELGERKMKESQEMINDEEYQNVANQIRNVINPEN